MAIIDNLTYKQAIELYGTDFIWLNGDKVIVDTSPENRVPKEIFAYQARLALIDSGLLSQVDTIINNTNGELKVRWEWSDILYRNSPHVISVANQLGLTSDQLDDLFIAASKK